MLSLRSDAVAPTHPVAPTVVELDRFDPFPLIAARSWRRCRGDSIRSVTYRWGATAERGCFARLRRESSVGAEWVYADDSPGVSIGGMKHGGLRAKHPNGTFAL